MPLTCVLCGNLLGKQRAVTFVDNADAGKGAAHLDCANAQKPARETPGEYLARMVGFWIVEDERNAARLVGPGPTQLEELADALEAYEEDEAAYMTRKLAKQERGEDDDE